MRLNRLFAAALLSAAVIPVSAKADPYGRTMAAPGAHLGGGFIEMLMTGRQPRRAAPAYVPVAAPQYRGHAPAANAIPIDDYGGYARPAQPAYAPEPRQAALSPDFRQVERGLDPRYLPQVVDYAGAHQPGTIVIDTPNKYLYLVESGGKARRYGIGVGRPGFEWAGVKTITRKAEWPDWRPPPQMLLRRPDLPRYMAGGPENPMGARGLYLGSSLYRIHGTNEPHTIGQAVSSGCIRMRNEDVTDLYERVRVGTKVIVM
jgi:lipoprotein-anchoring transpeptidase ErfK/SrfK